MLKQKEEWIALANYLPENSLDYVLPIILEHKVHLTITRPRQSKLGDYRLPVRPYENHKITINGNLNTYEFLITLLHEIAHMLCFIGHGRHVAPHGIEWQKTYSTLLLPAVEKKFFPEDVTKELLKTVKAPAASCQGELSLMRVLKKYNANMANSAYTHLIKTIEELTIGAHFKTKDGHIFMLEKKLRTRYLCLQVSTNKRFSFPALYQVMLVE
jgi:SprT protein